MDPFHRLLRVPQQELRASMERAFRHVGNSDAWLQGILNTVQPHADNPLLQFRLRQALALIEQHTAWDRIASNVRQWIMRDTEPRMRRVFMKWLRKHARDFPRRQQMLRELDALVKEADESTSTTTRQTPRVQSVAAIGTGTPGQTTLNTTDVELALRRFDDHFALAKKCVEDEEEAEDLDEEEVLLGLEHAVAQLSQTALALRQLQISHRALALGHDAATRQRLADMDTRDKDALVQVYMSQVAQRQRLWSSFKPAARP